MDQTSGCDPSQCPLCGESNQCARAADPEATQCWCGPEKFPRDLLERVPENAVRRACICHRCLKEHRKSITG
ncbi:MAG: cysteine-rich CWC family protein [Myxococcales bacterium]|nr:cysteine-rich CWC family protein [Myxococcales bacterium]